MRSRTASIVGAAALTVAVALPACRTSPRSHSGGGATALPDARSLPVLHGSDGTAASWDDMIAAAMDADVVFLGETHDDAVAHEAQRVFVEDVLDRDAGTAVSMEMLERNEQGVVDDYLDGIIDAEQLEALTLSSSWGGPGMWKLYYLPIIDAARAHGSAVIAANAPRRYVKLARTEGYDRLDALPPPRRDLVDRPAGDPSEEDAYRRRFMETFAGATDDVHAGMDQEMLDAMYRAQLVWDATMAASIDHALDDGATRVVHLCGHFHCDFDGGTVSELRRRRPGIRVLVVTFLPDDRDTLAGEDSGRADFVVYTGR